MTVFSSAVFLDGATGLAILAPVWIGLLALAFVSAGGRYAVEVAPTVGHFLLRQVTGQGSYRVRPSAPAGSRRSPAWKAATPSSPSPKRTVTAPSGLLPVCRH